MDINVGDTLECEITARERRTGEFIRVTVLQILLHPKSETVREVKVEGTHNGKYRCAWVYPKYLRAIPAESLP